MAGIAPAGLTVDQFGQVRAATVTLAGAWRPAAQGRSFGWRGVTAKGSLDSRLYQAASALQTLLGNAQVNRILAETVTMTRPSDAATLARLLGHLNARPEGLPDEWLTAGTLAAVDAAARQLAAELAEVTARTGEATRVAGVPWSAIPSSAQLPDPADHALSVLVPPAADVGGLAAPRITALATTFAADAAMLEKRLGALAGLASMLSFRAPETFGEADDLLAVAALTQQEDKPERDWLTASGLAAAVRAARGLQDAQQDLARAEAEAAAYYTPAVLDHDVEAIAARFGGGHHHLGKLSGEYRADRKALAAFTREGIGKDDARQFLGLAVGWKQAAAALAYAERDHAAVLGRSYDGRSTDFGRLDRALEVAATAVRRARGQDLNRFADCAAPDAAANPVVARAAAEISRDLNAWKATVGFGDMAAPPPELLGGPIRDAAGWLRAHLGPLGAATAYTQPVSDGVGRPVTGGEARYLAALRDAADAAEAHLAALDGPFSDMFGALYAGPETGIAAIGAALEWARALRLIINGTGAPLTPAQVKAADGGPSRRASWEPPRTGGSGPGTLCWAPLARSGARTWPPNWMITTKPPA